MKNSKKHQFLLCTRRVLGIPGALTAVSAIQLLFKLLTSRVEQIRSGASLALGYLSFDPEARRQLLNWCVHVMSVMSSLFSAHLYCYFHLFACFVVCFFGYPLTDTVVYKNLTLNKK